MEISFRDMGLKADLLQMIEKKGFTTPTPIQAKAIPPAMEGRDLMGQAQTGTGKTAAFGIPILNRIRYGDGIQAMVLCPTRELAVQVAEEINSLGRGLRIKVLAVYGGQSIDIQLRALRKRPEIIVGTPGRLLDHLDRGTIILADLKYVVLDEADEMLDMGFLPDIKKILSRCPVKRQTMLFSATLMDEIRELGQKFMHDPEVITIPSPELTVPLTKQYYYRVNSRYKVESVSQVLDLEQAQVSLIFCRTKKRCNELCRILNSQGYTANALHGDMSQRERDYVMQRFRKGDIAILVATDLAARGLDVDIVSHVFNFDVPESPDVYVHRIGRTGRAGRSGIAITLVEPDQMKQLRAIERHTGKIIKQKVLPSLAEALERRQQKIVANVLESSHKDLGNYRGIADKLLEKNDAASLLGAALKLLSSESHDIEEPVRQNSDNSNTVTIELPVGKSQGLNPRRLVELMVLNTSLAARQVGDIEIHSNNSFVEIPMAMVDEVYNAFNKMEDKMLNYRRTRDYYQDKKAT